MSKRDEAARLMISRAGMNEYTQGVNRDCFFGKVEGGPGYSDCSSAVRACVKRAAGIDIGGNTSAQISNRAKGILVEKAADGQIIPTEKNLLPGDCVYFKGNPDHVWDVGHVEMYTGPDTLYGHGSGKGPTKHALSAYCKGRGKGKEYLCTIRWIPEEEPVAVTTAAASAQITGGTVNLRTGPGTNHAAAKIARKGERYEPVDTERWRPIWVDGRVLWVSSLMSEVVRS